MKTRIHFLIVLCGAFFLQAQGQTKECDEKAAEISAFVKEEKFTEAYDSWNTAGKCASANEQTLLDAEKIFRYKIEAATSPTEKTEAVSALIKLYDTYDQKFPGNGNSNLAKKAKLLKDYELGTSDEIYQLLDRAYKTDTAHFTDAAALYLYFQLFVDKFKAAEKGIKEDDVFSKFDAVSYTLEQLTRNTNLPARNYKSALDGIKTLASPIATCEKLNLYYDKNFESKKGDSIWLQKASESLIWKGCTSTPLFLKITSETYAVKPTSKSGYNLGIAYLKNRNQKKAVEYFDAAANLETNPDDKAGIYYTTASTIYVDKAMALDYLKKSLAVKPTFGKAYLMMAQVYSESGTCAKTPFEKKALYLLAAQTAQKAAVDPTLKKAATRVAETYLQKVPTKAEIKEAKLGGKKITFGCYINESVIIPQ
ncbi:MAG TPA: hypothetical protein VK623_00040 [Flavobacterium sp.]|nr:hypothetical protein [Flavobacterium sp.]